MHPLIKTGHDGDYILLHENTDSIVLTPFDTDEGVLYGGSAPHKASSTGFVYIGRREFYPGVVNCYWKKLPSPGDRVQFTEAALEKCDPAVHQSETVGTVLEIRPSGVLLIQFDDGDRPGLLSAGQFEPEHS